jgi:hypothetical protein
MYIPVIIIVVLGASSDEASAHCNRDGIACVGVPTRGKDIDARQHRRQLIVRIAPATIGCYGFDHGPIYSCACRKLNPAILVMQSAQDWATKNMPGAIDSARDRRIFL